MKFITASIILFTAVIAHAGLPGLLTKEARDWGFIQSVGGMKVSSKERVLNVACDVSGTKKVTVKPTMINSALGVRKLQHKRDGQTIYLTVVTSVLEKGMTTSCKPLDLSAYPAGNYTVEYLNPDGTTQPLGSIILKEQRAGDAQPAAGSTLKKS